jgi:hypothetical protein
MASLVLHDQGHELILRYHQLLKADRCTWWGRGLFIATQGMPTTTPMAGRSLREVKHGILGGSSMHHLPQVAHTIRYLQQSSRI